MTTAWIILIFAGVVGALIAAVELWGRRTDSAFDAMERHAEELERVEAVEDACFQRMRDLDPDQWDRFLSPAEIAAGERAGLRKRLREEAMRKRA